MNATCIDAINRERIDNISEKFAHVRYFLYLCAKFWRRTEKQHIDQTAQAILDARAKYPNCSLADLYDEVAMPPELRKAHQENDRAVMAAYGFSTKMSESECVAELFKMYQEMTKPA